MKMADFTDLNKQDAIAKMVHHALIPFGVPPLDRGIELAAGIHDPERQIHAGKFVDNRLPPPLVRGQVNVTMELSRLQRDAEARAQEMDETVDAMVRRLVAAMD